MLSGKPFKKVAKAKFSIEDAFEEDADDSIRIYGATNERSPLKPLNSAAENRSDIEVRVQEPSIRSSSGHGITNQTHQEFLPLPTEPDTVSRDSDSLIPGESNYYQPATCSSWWCFHPKVREKWRIVAGAFTLFIVGAALIVAGIVIEVVPYNSLSGFVFLIAGLICFIPGVYHVVFIILAVRGRQGYDFYSLPLFN